MRRIVEILFVTAVLWFASAAATVEAHAFAERYDLPVPLPLFLAGAATAVAITFVLMALFIGRQTAAGEYLRLDVSRFRLIRLFIHPASLASLRVFSVAVFFFILIAGFDGNQQSFRNIAPTFVWVIWWVGLAFVNALIGDLWRLLNPWKILFGWVDALYARGHGGRPRPAPLAYPARLGAWPAILLFLGFAWIELAWTGNTVPARLAAVICIYSSSPGSACGCLAATCGFATAKPSRSRSDYSPASHRWKSAPGRTASRRFTCAPMGSVYQAARAPRPPRPSLCSPCSPASPSMASPRHLCGLISRDG